MKAWRKYVAEMIGTMMLVLLGCGAAVFVPGGSAAWVVAVAFAFGFALVAAAYTIGTISGCHINPAVSLAMAIKKKISWKDFGFYALFQVIGAIIGALILFAMIKIMGGNSMLGSNSYSGFTDAASAKGIGVALVAEIVLTFIFVLTILGVTRKKDNKVAAGLIIGITLVVIHLVGIGITGTSVNPARSFGPALVSAFNDIAALKEVWLFIVAPLAGAVLAAFTACFLFKGDDDSEAEKVVKPKVEAPKAKVKTKTKTSKGALRK